MKATLFTRFGGPDVLAVIDVPDPAPADGEARVRIKAASINPSDVKNVAGAMSQTVLPRIPGRDFAGVVDAGADAWIGAEVWGSGNAGFVRDGSHAEYIIRPPPSGSTSWRHGGDWLTRQRCVAARHSSLSVRAVASVTRQLKSRGAWVPAGSLVWTGRLRVRIQQPCAQRTFSSPVL
jgi:NADPH:quinone reductase-like Zn-dependent oxidoreductase